MKNNKPIALIILDGFGYSPTKKWNAIAQAHTPHLFRWFKTYPHTLLNASGGAVGLPENYIGNSEVGHQTIGAGRTVEQPSTTILKAIASGALLHNAPLQSELKKLARSQKNLHVIGLLSDAGVHSHHELLYALIAIAEQYYINQIYIHAILDGRDVPPQSAQQYLERCEKFIKRYNNITIASLHGRFYAMDRDKNTERTEKSFVALTQNNPSSFKNWQEALAHYYQQGITDEYIPPTQLADKGTIAPGDGVICFNFRPDRSRQITQKLLQEKDRLKFSFFITPFSYGTDTPTNTLFQKPIIKNVLTDILYQHNIPVFAIAETEKYAHITYFFNSGRHTPYTTEVWKLIPSLKTKNYKTHPEMSAPTITQNVLESLRTNPKKLYIINYANADMVGHTGDMHATMKAIACLDQQLYTLYTQIVANMDGTLIITADHGNAEQMFDPISKQPKTAHTTNPVPFLVVTKKINQDKKLPLHSLADIAPYLLEMMDLPIPQDMQRD